MAGMMNAIEATREAVLAGKLPSKSLGDVIQAGVECANEVDGLKRTLAEKEATIASLQAQLRDANGLANGLRAERFAEAQRALQLSLQTEESRRLDALKAKLHVFGFVAMCNDPGSSSHMEELGTLVKIVSRGDTRLRLGNGPYDGENHQLKDGEEVYFTVQQATLGKRLAQEKIQDLEQKLQTQRNLNARRTERVEHTEGRLSRLKTTLRDLGFDRRPSKPSTEPASMAEMGAKVGEAMRRSGQAQPYSPFPGGVQPFKADCQGEGDRNG